MGAIMKGIILAGGKGSRLYPLTAATSKQLLPIYDKPMIYYPLAMLMKAGIRDILIITTAFDMSRFQLLLGDGRQFGIHITYKSQASPDGLPQAFNIGEEFIGNNSVALVLGDNIFVGEGIEDLLKIGVKNTEDGRGATVFAYQVPDPERFGIVEFDQNWKALSIEEKPIHPKSNYCVTGMYFYDNTVVEKAKCLERSPRGEYEITDLNRSYLEADELNVVVLDQRFKWFDTGTPDSLLEASNYINTTEKKNNRKIACLEEIAISNNWVNADVAVEPYSKKTNNEYGKYIKSLLPCDP